MTTLTLTNTSVIINHRTILDAVSLAFEPGNVTAIIGPNGAGKSTLLSVCAGHIRPTYGSVRIGASDVSRLGSKQAARKRAVMPQDVTVAFPFTVREVVAMGRTSSGTTSKQDAKIVTETLRATELTRFADREITTLSGGERQRVALARIIAQATPIGPTSILLLDEPTSAMDISHAEATLRIMRHVAAQGAAVGIVVHDLDAAASYADTIVLMSDGKIEAIGPPSQVCTPNQLSKVYATPIDVISHGDGLRVLPQRHHSRKATPYP